MLDIKEKKRKRLKESNMKKCGSVTSSDDMLSMKWLTVRYCYSKISPLKPV